MLEIVGASNLRVSVSILQNKAEILSMKLSTYHKKPRIRDILRRNAWKKYTFNFPRRKRVNMVVCVFYVLIEKELDQEFERYK